MDESYNDGNVFQVLSQLKSNDKVDKINISSGQRDVINKLRSELSKSSQLLVMVQGEAGSGKSTIC